jgi:hypothetical protein
MNDEAFDNPHHGHADEGSPTMPREAILYPHEWADIFGVRTNSAGAYRGPIHPQDTEGVRYVPAEPVEALEAAAQGMLHALDALDYDDWTREMGVLRAALDAYHDASREPKR